MEVPGLRGQARTLGGVTPMANQPCKRHITARIPEQEALGPSAHTFWTAEADGTAREGGANVTWRSVCGAESGSKLHKPRGRCPGPVQKAVLTMFRTLHSLRRPEHGYRLLASHRMTDNLMRAMGDVANPQNEEVRRRLPGCGSRGGPRGRRLA